MPRLKPSEIPGYVGSYESPFPAAEMTDGVPGSAWTDIAAVTAPVRAWRASHRISGLAIGRVATRHGLPDFQVPALKRLGDLAEVASPSDFVALAKSGARLFGDLLDYSKALTTVASAVPVVGTYARLIVGFVGFLRQAFGRGAASKATVKKTARDALGYNRQIDEDVCNFAAEKLGADDWTRIFLPSWKPGDGFALQRTSFVGDGTPDGYTILPSSGAKSDEGLGFTPGVAGRMVQWQYPIKLFRSNRQAGPWESLISIADLEPSVTQLTVAAWQMVLRNSPDMFRIRPYKIVTRWADFFDTLADWSRWLRDRGDTQGATMAEAVATWVGKEYPGGPYRVRNPWTKYTKGALESGKVQTVSAGDLVRFIVHRQHSEALDAALATLTCAYVGPHFPLIEENEGVRDQWFARRKQLLQHRARFDVELDMVPDQDYRAALTEARKGGKPSGGKPIPKGLGGVPRFADPKQPPPPASAIEPSMPNSAGGGSGHTPKSGDGGAGGAALAVGAALAAFFALR